MSYRIETLEALSRRFPVGSVHRYVSARSDFIFLIVGEAQHDPEDKDEFCVRYVNLETGAIDVFWATSDMDNRSIRVT